MAAVPADLEIRPLRPGDDPDAQLDLSERAFGPGSAADRDRRVRSLSRLIAGGRYLGAFADGRPAAGAAFQDMRQVPRRDLAQSSRCASPTTPAPLTPAAGS